MRNLNKQSNSPQKPKENRFLKKSYSMIAILKSPGRLKGLSHS
jgi:hypothetical protein